MQESLELIPEDRLAAVFVEALQLPAGTPCGQLAYGDTDAWDSVAHMALVAAVEAEFDVQLATEEVIAMSSYHVAKEILARHGICFAQ